MTRLICESCGGPLPRPSGASPYLTCSFCGCTTALEADASAPEIAAEAQASAVELRARHEPAFRAFETAIAKHPVPDKAAFVAAATASLGQLCDPNALANVTFGLALEFRDRTGVDLRREQNALPRIAIAYLGALGDAHTGTLKLAVPFIATTDAGPCDFAASPTLAELGTLARTEPEASKRGFISRLFGRG